MFTCLLAVSFFAGLPRIRKERLMRDHRAAAGLPRPTTYFSICRRYCTGFHSQKGSCPWCACPTGRPPIWVSFTALFLLVLPCTAVFWPRRFGVPIRPLCDIAHQFPVCSLSKT